MPIYEFKRNDKFEKVPTTTMVKEKIEERYDLQALLIKQIGMISDECLVITEEYSNFSDSGRRIDILAVDQNANLVVIELKRNKGEHMELQALRYAAMVSTMTLEDAIEAHASFLQDRDIKEDAKERIKKHVGEEKFTDDHFNNDVRIILVSEDFNKEITSSVLWLNERDLDIRCFRLRAYNFEGRILFDVQQLIPLPETSDYQMQVKKKEQRQRSSRRKKTISPELKAVLDAYTRNYSETFPVNYPNTPSVFAQVQIPNWPKSMHYEFLESGNWINVLIHTENKELARLTPTLEEMSAHLNSEFGDGTLVECLPMGSRSAGKVKIQIKYSVDTDPETIARAMATLIDKTHVRIHAALEEHGLLETTDAQD